MSNPLSLGLASIAEGLRKAQASVNSPESRWRRGDLGYKFWPVQHEMAAVLRSPSSLTKVLNCSRRLRKTSTALTLAIELALQRKKAQIRFAASTGKQLRKIVHPLVKLITNDAPSDLKPIWKSQDGLYFFPSSGAELHLAGVNNGHEDDLRGTEADLFVIDEAQVIDKLKYLVDDVAMPQLLTTDGQLWVLLTPPTTPVHESVSYVQEAQLAGPGHYAEFDIYRSEYPADRIERFCKKSGGKESTTWQREYMCKFVVDENFHIIPEWKDEYVQEYVQDELYKYYAKYEGMDIGVRDLTVNLFGTYDFRKATLYIEDEFAVNGPRMTTQVVADAINGKEKALWGETKPRLRISDNNNLFLLQDLGLLHGIYFAPTNKDTLEAMVNEVRLWVSKGRIKVSPKCTQLIGCLKYGVWNGKRKEFERSINFGHFDALAALIYLVRNIDVNSNPVPPNWNANPDRDYIRDQGKLVGNAKVMKQALLGKKK